MNRKFTAMFLVVGAIMLSRAMGADDDLPKPLSFARYEPILNHSPFAVATAAAVAPMTADFAKDLYIANAAHSPEGDWVALASSTDANFRKYLTTKQGMDGYTLSNIEWSDRVGETKVTVSKDGQYSTLSFNQALLASPLPRAGMMPNMNPAAVNANIMPTTDLPANRIRPAPIPMLPTPPPRVRGVIQRNPSMPKMQGQMQAPVAPVAVPQPVEEPPEKQ